ncbi:bile acid:sodium symporter family protein [Psychromonas sp. Urea-02u-13]|uniref:bile acid:sodium symporter family protein n=1 Tax=Psychromonas sp. Urea-02u-13 TaxID=2058326 RepID=UPI000C32E594|nr:bile acid:sodium symporter family protein [Psychromonas sp. Urea-02u-13]PKG37145.1 hypothetical protein CXF74_20410 [Psychromonas sp. Urea-02u-13]
MDIPVINLLNLTLGGYNVSDIATGALILMMATMGLTLKLSDFSRVVTQPLPVITGLLIQLLALPAVAFLLIAIYDPAFPIAIGMIILACCPSAATSNFFTHIAKGDTALSVSLTAMSGLIVVFTTPLLINLGFMNLTGEGQTIYLPLLPSMLQIFNLIILPVTVGMGVRHFYASFAQTIEPYATKLSFISILFVMCILFAEVYPSLSIIIELALVPVLTLNIVMMLLGITIAKLLKLNRQQARSICIEIGIQNYVLAVVIAIAILKKPEFAIAAIVYLFSMYACVFTFLAYCRFQDMNIKQTVSR